MGIQATTARPAEDKIPVTFGPTELFKCLYLITKKSGGKILFKRERVEELDENRKINLYYDEKSDCFAFTTDIDPPRIILPDHRIRL